MKKNAILLIILFGALMRGWAAGPTQPHLAPSITPEPASVELSATEYYALEQIRLNCPDKSAAEWARKHLTDWYGAYAPKVKVGSTKKTNLGTEAYELTTGKKEVEITAQTLQGARYALYSLRQIAIPKRGTLKVQGWIVPKGFVQDSPCTSFRGIHICWFHEREPWEIERLIRLAAYYKLNYAVIESWGTFRSDVAPWYGWPDGTMTKAEVARLKAIADDLGITLIPQINVFGHAMASRGGAGKHAILDLTPEAQSLFEPSGGRNWCLSNPEARKLLTKLIEERMDAFGNPPFFHIGGDEASPPSCPNCISQSYSKLFVDHVKALNEVIRKKGARTMMWHDMLLQKDDPRWKGDKANGTKETAEALLGFPRDIIMCYWFYRDPREEYPALPYFKELGFQTLVCPWMNVEGLHAMAMKAREGQTDGILGTLWHHDFGGDLVTIYLNLSNSAWNAGAKIRRNQVRAHLRQIAWDMKNTDPKRAGIYYYELPDESFLNN